MLATDLPQYKNDKAASHTLYTRMVEKLFQSLNRTFISDRLLQDTLNDARQRALVLVGVLVVSAISGLSMALGLTALYAFNREPLYLFATVIAFITVLGYLGTLWYFKEKQALLPAANYYGITTTFSTIMPCVITGGISASPYVTVILVVPIFLFLIAGRRQGVHWSVIVATCVLILALLESLGVSFPQIIPVKSMVLFRFVTWSMTLALLVLGLMSYEGDFESLTRRILEERRLFAHEAMHDPLTGLSNRKLFFSRAKEAVEYALSREFKAVVIYVDLDDFKLINDGFGHDIGDDVLNAVAQRLQANVRSVDTVARLGGDEFAIVLHGIEKAEVADLMVEKLRAALQQPLQIGQHSLSASGSIGVAIAPDHGRDVTRLLKKADEAMYRAKQFRVRIGH
jgi:diguanylate cyclase (GGDEF)-like protein